CGGDGESYQEQQNDHCRACNCFHGSQAFGFLFLRKKIVCVLWLDLGHHNYSCKWLCTKSTCFESSLCNLCVLCDSVVSFCSEFINHREKNCTEKSATETFVQSRCNTNCDPERLSAFRQTPQRSAGRARLLQSRVRSSGKRRRGVLRSQVRALCAV